MTKYMDRRTKKFKSLEENVRKLLKQELDMDVIRIAEIEDTDVTYEDEQMLYILVKFNESFGDDFVESGFELYVNKDLFNATQDWFGVAFNYDKVNRLNVLNILPGLNVLKSI